MVQAAAKHHMQRQLSRQSNFAFAIGKTVHSYHCIGQSERLGKMLGLRPVIFESQ